VPGIPPPVGIIAPVWAVGMGTVCRVGICMPVCPPGSVGTDIPGDIEGVGMKGLVGVVVCTGVMTEGLYMSTLATGGPRGGGAGRGGCCRGLWTRGFTMFRISP
jgi:hypothetical protein